MAHAAASLEDEFRSIVRVFPCQVQWGDCDPAGIIFYPTYFRWMDAAAWAFFDSLGYDAKRMREEHRALPLLSADCRFIAPAEQADRCEVRSRIARIGGKSFVLAHDVVRADGIMLASGSETRVWARYANGPGTPMRGETIPDDLRARLRAP